MTDGSPSPRERSHTTRPTTRRPRPGRAEPFKETADCDPGTAQGLAQGLSQGPGTARQSVRDRSAHGAGLPAPSPAQTGEFGDWRLADEWWAGQASRRLNLSAFQARDSLLHSPVRRRSYGGGQPAALRASRRSAAHTNSRAIGGSSAMLNAVSPSLGCAASPRSLSARGLPTSDTTEAQHRPVVQSWSKVSQHVNGHTPARRLSLTHPAQRSTAPRSTKYIRQPDSGRCKGPQSCWRLHPGSQVPGAKRGRGEETDPGEGWVAVLDAAAPKSV